jgi:hypothetical protein
MRGDESNESAIRLVSLLVFRLERPERGNLEIKVKAWQESQHWRDGPRPGNRLWPLNLENSERPTEAN